MTSLRPHSLEAAELRSKLESDRPQSPSLNHWGSLSRDRPQGFLKTSTCVIRAPTTLLPKSASLRETLLLSLPHT